MSQYVHELTTGRIQIDVHDAIERHHELIEYSRYAMQLQPFLDAYRLRERSAGFLPEAGESSAIGARADRPLPRPRRPASFGTPR